MRQTCSMLGPATAAFLVGAVVAGIGLAATGAQSQSQTLVSQKGREFSPGSVSVAKGEAVVIVNDDLDLRHHAYIESSKFDFDSGDQEPGSKTSIVIPIAGTFEVLCAIHPKMRLVINVR